MAQDKFQLRQTMNGLIVEWSELDQKQLIPYENSTVIFLEKVYTLGDEISKNEEMLDAFRSIAKEDKITFKKETSIYQRILVVCMKDNENRRQYASKNAKVIDIAKRNKVAPKEFSSWIKSNRGIENIAYPKVEKKEGKVELKIARAKKFLEQQNSISTLGKKDLKNDTVGFVVLLGKVNSNFTTDILYRYDDERTLNSILQKMGGSSDIVDALDLAEIKAIKKKANKALSEAVAKASKNNVKVNVEA